MQKDTQIEHGWKRVHCRKDNYFFRRNIINKYLRINIS